MNELIQQVYGDALDVNKLLRRIGQMKKKRETFLGKWQRIKDIVAPNTSEYNGIRKFSKGSDTYKIGNHCSAISGMISKTVSDLTSQIMDPLVDWLGLSIRKAPTILTDGMVVSFSEDQSVQRWLFECTEVCYDLFADPKTNFYASNFAFMYDWFTIGTATKHITVRNDTGEIVFNPISMNDICIDIGAYGDISYIARQYNLTPEQAFSLWGEAIGLEQLQIMQQSQGSDRKFEYVELCMPTPPEIIAQNPFAVAPYLSVVINKQMKTIISIVPELSFPYVVARFDVSPGDIYGKSLVWQAMPDILVENRTSKKIIQGIDYAATPALLASDALGINVGQLTPGGIVNGLNADGKPTIMPLQMGMDIGAAMQFYTQKFAELTDQLLANDIIPQDSNGALSPTEVIRREIQRNNRIRPLLVRLEADDLRFTIKRTMQLLQQQGALPQFPYDSLGLSPEQLPNPLEMIKISFSGQMAKMRKMQDVQSINNLVSMAFNFAQADPSALQIIKLPEAVKEMADVFNVPKTILKSDEELMAEAVAQQEQMAQEQEAATEQQDMQKQILEGELAKQGLDEMPEDML